MADDNVIPIRSSLVDIPFQQRERIAHEIAYSAQTLQIAIDIAREYKADELVKDIAQVQLDHIRNLKQITTKHHLSKIQVPKIS